MTGITTSRRRIGHLLIALGAAVAAVLALGPSFALAQPAVAFPTKPLVGTCHQVRWVPAKQSYRGRTVSCQKRHNVVTVAVPQAPESLAGLNTTEIDALAASTCEPLMLQRLGQDAALRSMSAYHFLFGHPSATQIAEGERWFRCDMTLSAGKKLLPLPTRLPRPILGKGLTYRTERCLTKAGLATICSHKHVYRPIGAVTFRHMTYPTHTAFELASRRCPAATAWWTANSEDRWAAGDRVLVCYAKTRK